MPIGMPCAHSSKDFRIEWTHHTLQPWWGCIKVSPACDHCYAESWAGDTCIGVHSAVRQEPVEPMSGQWHLVMSAGVDPCAAVAEAGATGNDVNLPPLSRWWVAMLEPRRVDGQGREF